MRLAVTGREGLACLPSFLGPEPAWVVKDLDLVRPVPPLLFPPQGCASGQESHLFMCRFFEPRSSRAAQRGQGPSRPKSAFRVEKPMAEPTFFSCRIFEKELSDVFGVLQLRKS